MFMLSIWWFCIKVPLEWGVLESIDWISLLDSSPWLWENWFIVCCELLYLLSNSLVTNILSLSSMMMMMFMLSIWCFCIKVPFESWVLESIVSIRFLLSSSWKWEDISVFTCKFMYTFINHIWVISNVEALLSILMKRVTSIWSVWSWCRMNVRWMPSVFCWLVCSINRSV